MSARVSSILVCILNTGNAKETSVLSMGLVPVGSADHGALASLSTVTKEPPSPQKHPAKPAVNC